MEKILDNNEHSDWNMYKKSKKRVIKWVCQKIKWSINFSKISNAKALDNIYNQEIYNYLTKEEKFSKRLEDCLMKKKG